MGWCCPLSECFSPTQASLEMSSQTCLEVCLLGDSKIHQDDKINHQNPFIIGIRVYSSLTYRPHSLDYEPFSIIDAASSVPRFLLVTP